MLNVVKKWNNYTGNELLCKEYIDIENYNTYL